MFSEEPDGHRLKSRRLFVAAGREFLYVPLQRCELRTDVSRTGWQDVVQVTECGGQIVHLHLAVQARA
jgi:hypothetical protein